MLFAQRALFKGHHHHHQRYSERWENTCRRRKKKSTKSLLQTPELNEGVCICVWVYVFFFPHWIKSVVALSHYSVSIFPLFELFRFFSVLLLEDKINLLSFTPQDNRPTAGQVFCALFIKPAASSSSFAPSSSSEVLQSFATSLWRENEWWKNGGLYHHQHRCLLWAHSFRALTLFVAELRWN